MVSKLSPDEIAEFKEAFELFDAVREGGRTVGSQPPSVRPRGGEGS